MRNRLLAAAFTTLILAGQCWAQPPGGPRRGPPDPFGPPPGGPGLALERVLDDLKLSERKMETATQIVRAHQADLRRLNDLAGAEMLLKMKEFLSPEEFKRLRESLSGPGGGPRATQEDIVERIMSFDKNKDGKITRDELPERMQDLIEKGDTNKDGALDRDEIKKLAADLARDGFPGGGPGDGFFPGPGGPGGPGGRLPPGPGGRGGRPPGPGFGLPPRELDRAVDELKLTDQKKESANAALRAHHDNMRKLTDMARAELLLRMDEVLSAEEFKSFQAALERLPPPGERPPRRPRE